MNAPTQLNFDASTVDPNFGGGGSFLPVSDERGWLCVLTADNGFKPSKSGKGQYLELAGKCVENGGPAAGKDFTLRLNLQHESIAAVNAAYAQLSALAHVTGVMRVGTTADLFNKPFRLVSVLQDAANANGYTQLADNGIRDQNGNKPGQAGQGAQAAQPSPQQMGQPGQPAQGQPGPQWGQPGPGAGQPAQGQPTNAQGGGWGQPGQPQGQPQGGGWQGQPAQPQDGGQNGGGTPGWAAQPQGQPQGQPAGGGWQSGPASGQPSWTR